MKNIFTTLFLTLLAAAQFNASAWSQKGHDATAAIAQNHLTPATAEAVNEILNGHSLVYWSNWLDNASYNDPDFADMRSWHFINVDPGQTYETAPRNPAGDAVTAIRRAISVLSDTESTDSLKNLYMRVLTHVVGDLHQPMHTGRGIDRGGNDIKVNYFGSDKNLHSVWDGSLLESAHRWSYSEWRDQIDILDDEDYRIVIAGNIDDWARQSNGLAELIYEAFPVGAKISYGDVYRWTPVIEEQVLKGGLRLAHILNLIFDPDYDAPTAISDAHQL